MKNQIFTRLLTFTLLSLLARPSLAQEWDFEVFLDDKPIGSHRFTLTADGAAQKLLSVAAFDVKFLFINAYSYRHQSQESWQGDCLQQIRSETDDNGTPFQVSGQRADAAFAINSKRGDDSSDESLPACIMTFAYWNPAMLTQDRLLDPQTGQYKAITITPLDSAKGLQRYRLSGDEIAIELGYSSDTKDWRELQSTTPDGYVIRYRRR